MHKRETSKIVGIMLVVFGLVVAIAWYLNAREPDVIDYPVSEIADEPVPDFADIEDVKEKKQAFVDYLRPEVERQNEYLLSLRHYLMTLQRQIDAGEMLLEDDYERVEWLREEYNVDEEASIEEAMLVLLRRIDILPVGLVLVQAANESAWGTSRFAQDGYNFFGLWCFKKGCGFVPNRRDSDAAHEVAKFDDLSRAMYVYMRNLNRHPAYKELRQIRQTLRNNQMPINGIALSEGLMSYSERGAAYVEELQGMMRYNQEYWD